MEIIRVKILVNSLTQAVIPNADSESTNRTI